jgi:hypothetical protein
MAVVIAVSSWLRRSLRLLVVELVELPAAPAVFVGSVVTELLLVLETAVVPAAAPVRPAFCKYNRYNSEEFESLAPTLPTPDMSSPQAKNAFCPAIEYPSASSDRSNYTIVQN